MEKLKSDDYRYLMLSERNAVLELKKAKLSLKILSQYLDHIDAEMKIISNILDCFEENDFC